MASKLPHLSVGLMFVSVFCYDESAEPPKSQVKISTLFETDSDLNLLSDL